MLYPELHNGSLFHFFCSSFFHVLIRLHMFCINSTSASSMSSSIYLHYRFLLLLFKSYTSIRAFLGEGCRKGREGREREEMKAPIGSWGMSASKLVNRQCFYNDERNTRLEASYSVASPSEIDSPSPRYHCRFCLSFRLRLECFFFRLF